MLIDRDAPAAGRVALVGVPSDQNSSLLAGPAAAPGCIRSALYDPQMNMSAEDARNLAREPRFVDAGDLDLQGREPAHVFSEIVAGVGSLLARGARVLALGGDHGVAYPLVKTHADHLGPFAIVQIDAHPDLYDDLDGNRFSHASPFARIMEEKLATRIVQIGIRAATGHQREQAERFGVDILDPDDMTPAIERFPTGPVYLSLDLDGLDPAFAPGVSHPEAGGLTTREAIRIIHRLPGPLIGADLVELNPRRDVNGVTALVAAKLVREIAARLLADTPADG